MDFGFCPAPPSTVTGPHLEGAVKSMRPGLLRRALVLAVLLIYQRGAMATTPDGQQKTDSGSWQELPSVRGDRKSPRVRGFAIDSESVPGSVVCTVDSARLLNPAQWPRFRVPGSAEIEEGRRRAIPHSDSVA